MVMLGSTPNFYISLSIVTFQTHDGEFRQQKWELMPEIPLGPSHENQEYWTPSSHYVTLVRNSEALEIGNALIIHLT